MAGRTGGNNPIKYSDIFDLSDKSVIKELIDNLQLIDKEFVSLSDSLLNHNKIIRESFTRMANEIIESSKKLNLALQDDRQALILLAQAVEDLKNKQQTLQTTNTNTTNTVTHAADSVNGLKERIAALTKEYNALSKSQAAEAARMAEIVKEAQALKKEQKELTDAMKLARTQTDFVAGSYKALEEETKRLMKELKELPNGFDKSNKAGQDMIKQINANNTQLKEFDKTLNIHNRNVGNYAEALGKTGDTLAGFGTSMAATYLGFQSFSDLAEKIISDNIEVSDTLADVQRTAGLTAKEVDELSESLKKLDTRTTINELAELAVIGGQLGYETTKDLAGFTKAIDQLAVSLAGEIEGGAEAIATSLGKINEVFKVQEKENTTVEESFLKTGSAILRLGQIGLATGEQLTDFTKRLGGVANLAGIGLPTILAYGATLEELGLTAEVSGTAVSQLITQLAKAPAKFYEVAKAADPKLTLQAFTDMINTDTASALDAFFKGLNQAGTTMTGFNRILGEMGIRGVRSNAVIQALAKNQELLHERVGQVTEAYNKGTLATEQFEIKNTNLAAAVAKLGNTLTNSFVNSGFSRGLASFINQLVDAKTAADDLTDSFVRQEERVKNLDSKMPPLLNSYDSLIAKAKELGGTDKLTSEEQAKLNSTIQQIAQLMPSAISQVNAYGDVVGIARDKIMGLTDAMRTNLRLVNKEAAETMRKEIEDRNTSIRLQQQAIQQGTFAPQRRGLFGTSIPRGRDALAEDAQRQIAENALKNAEAIRKLKDVLLQELSPAEQKVYDDFFVNSKRAADGNERDTEKIIDQSQPVIDALDNMGKAGKRVLTEFEKLEKMVELLKNTLQSQALHGEVNAKTLDEYVAAVHRLEDAQLIAQEAITKSIDPYQNLANKSDYLNTKLQRQIGLGEDTTQTIADLSDVTEQMRVMQDAFGLSVASTVGQFEYMNKELEITRRLLLQQISVGENYTSTLQTLGEQTRAIEEVTRQMNIAILTVTDPMGALAAQVEEYKRILTEQAAQGVIAGDAIDDYKDSIDALTEAQEKLNKATKYNPKDPLGNIENADINLEQNAQSTNLFENRAKDGDPGALANYRGLQKQRLDILMERLNAEQAALTNGSLEWEKVETEKTRVLAEQERLRTEIAKEETQKRSEIIQQALEFIQTGVNGFFDIQKARRDNDLSDLESQKKKELDLAGSNAAAQDKINEKYAKKEAEIKRKQAEADKLAALFNIAINTAMGATKAVAQFPATGGMPFLAFVLAQGALQAALVAAQPLPKYWKGRRNGPAEFAVLGEMGPEAVESRDGKVRMTPAGAHIGFLQAGDKVHRSDSAETAAFKQMLNATSSNASSNNADSAYVGASIAIMKARQGYDIYTAGMAMQSMAKSFNIAALKAAFSDALDERPYQTLEIDGNGFRVYENEKNARIEKLNNRNTFGGNG